MPGKEGHPGEMMEISQVRNMLQSQRADLRRFSVLMTGSAMSGRKGKAEER